MARTLTTRGGCGRLLGALGAAVLALLALLAAGGAAEASAKASGPSFAVQPLDPATTPYLMLPARPGQLIERQVRVVNVGDREGAVRLYAVDATTGATTGAVYRDGRAPRRGVGRWVALSHRRLTLAPGAAATVAVRIRVPRRVRAGHHLGGIVAENMTQRAGPRSRGKRGTLRVKIRNLTVLAVQLDLPGKVVERLAIEGVKPGSVAATQTLVLALRNRGNRLLKGSGRVAVSVRGRRIRSASFPVDTFVPGTGVGYPAVLKGRPLRAGRYRADVVIRYGRGRVVRHRSTFAVSRKQAAALESQLPPQPPAEPGKGPNILWFVLGGIALLLTGFGTAAVIFRRRAAVDAVL